jgi:hypothetical protein
MSHLCGQPLRRCADCDNPVGAGHDVCPACACQDIGPGTCRNPVKAEGLRCRYHGGVLPRVQHKAVERQVESDLAQLLERYDSGPVTNPLEALLELAGEVLAWKTHIGDRVARLQAEEWRWEGRLAEQTRAEVTLYERALDRAGSLLVSVARLDLDERVARLNARVTELQGLTLLAALEATLADLGLDAPQMVRARAYLSAELERGAPSGG